MRITSSKTNRRSGSVLAVTLLTTLIIGIALTGYIVLVANNNQSGMRSGAWNAAIPVAEAGLEEALAHLNRNFPTNIFSAGWELDGTNLVRTRSLGVDSYTVRFSAATNSIVECSGSVLLPWNGTHVTRTIRLQTRWTGVVLKAFAAKEDIKLNGYNIRSDSFDSRDTNYSTLTGGYDPAKAKDGGDIATNSSLDGGLNAGNAKVYGKLSTGPDGSVNTGPNLSVGNTAWHDAGNTGIQPGWVNDDSNVLMPDLSRPFNGGAFFPGGGNIDGTNYNHILGSDNYQVVNFGGRVLVTGQAVLLVTKRVLFTGNDFIRIAPGGSLRLYVEASAANIGGNGVINETGNAANFSYYGLPSNTSLSISGNGELIGVIYAPSAKVDLNGGGNFYGAISCKTASMNGGFSFHFDEALADSVPLRRFNILSWDEI